MVTYLRFFDYDKAFDHYCEAVEKMRCGSARGSHAKIIAKPALILAIIRLIEAGKSVNRFDYEEIEPVYEAIFRKWFLPSRQTNLTPLSYPFYYLRSDGFWHFTWTDAETKTSSPSRAWILRNCKFATIDKELWILLSHPAYRERMKEFVVEERVKKAFKGVGRSNASVFRTLLHWLLVV